MSLLSDLWLLAAVVSGPLPGPNGLAGWIQPPLS